jgi:hypothetical protein
MKRRCVVLALGFLILLAESIEARTITLTAEDCDEMAVLSAKAPRLSWPVILANTGTYNTENSMQLFSDMALLMRFPLDQIPRGQRITKAELSLPAEYVAGNPKVGVRRILAEWGHGVCHQYRMTFPQKVEWTKGGALGAGTDRTARDSAVFRMDKTGEHTVDVTEDVELWYTGATANRGWVLAIDNDGVVYTASPYAPHPGGGKRWKLTITFEAR